MSRCLSVPDAAYIPTYIMSLPQEQAAKIKNAFSGKDPARELFSIIHSYFETQCKYYCLLSTKYAYCSAEKRAQN